MDGGWGWWSWWVSWSDWLLQQIPLSRVLAKSKNDEHIKLKQNIKIYKIWLNGYIHWWRQIRKFHCKAYSFNSRPFHSCLLCIHPLETNSWYLAYKPHENTNKLSSKKEHETNCFPGSLSFLGAPIMVCQRDNYRQLNMQYCYINVRLLTCQLCILLLVTTSNDR